MKERFAGLVEHLLDNGFFLEGAVELLEKRLIRRGVDRSKGNRSGASKVLGLHRHTLQRKLAEYELETRRIKRKPPSREEAAGRTRTRRRIAK